MNWIKSHKLIIGILGALGIGGSIAIGAITNLEPPFVPTSIEWTRPTTDAEWAEDVKAEQLNYRFDFQLEEMKINLEERLTLRKQQLNDLIICPSCFKYPLQKEGLELSIINDKYNDDLSQKREMYERTKISLERVNKEIDLRIRKVVIRKEDILKIKTSTDREREELGKLRLK